MYRKKVVFGIVFFILFQLGAVSSFAASLSLSPASGTYNQGCAFSVAINVNTAGVSTDGTDAILRFNQSQLQVNSIIVGTIYPSYPTQTSSNGVIYLSGSSSLSSSYNGSGTLATINFTVKSGASGSSALTFDFDPANPGKTSDSNVIQTATSQDVLTSVGNGSYTLGSGSCSGNTGSTNPTPTPVSSGSGSGSSSSTGGTGSTGSTGYSTGSTATTGTTGSTKTGSTTTKGGIAANSQSSGKGGYTALPASGAFDILPFGLVVAAGVVFFGILGYYATLL